MPFQPARVSDAFKSVIDKAMHREPKHVELFDRPPADKATFELPFDLIAWGKSQKLAPRLVFRAYLLARPEVGTLPTGRCFASVEQVQALAFFHRERLFEGFFDIAYYWRRYSDVARAKADPLRHYLDHGAIEKRDPSPDFCTAHYLRANGDMVPEGLNPLVHYILAGRHMGAAVARPITHVPAPAPGEVMALEHNPEASLVHHEELRRFAFMDRAPTIAPPGEFAPDQMDIHWVIPDFAAGGGGHMTIFRCCNWLEQQGHKLTIWIRDPQMHRTPAAARETIFQHFLPLKGEIRILNRDSDLKVASGDAIFATDAFTVPFVVAARGFKRKFYFVQDFEAHFSAPGSRSLLARSTYSEDLDCVCAGRWLEGLMKTFGRWAVSFDLAAESDVYRPPADAASAVANAVPVIAFYSRMFTERRAVELGLLGLEVLAARGIKFEVELFGQGELPFSAAPFPARNHGVCDGFKLAEIYRKSDVGVVFSATNYSLVPQEMMCAGLPVVDLDLESTRAVYDPDAVTLAVPTPEGIADAIEALLKDPERRARQRQAAFRWVQPLTWENSCATVENAVRDRLLEVGFKPKAPSVQTSGAIRATVVIPTYNGGALLETVLDRVQEQRLDGGFEILCIDSSSSDGTTERLRKRSGIRCEVIDKKQFQHGRTRNLGAELARGEFVAYLTQDALPINRAWLHNLVCVLERFPEVGGAFGRHRAYDHSSAFIHHDIEGFFSGLQKEPLLFTLKNPEMAQRINEIPFRQLAHYYSDNNSCLRRSIWQKVRIPDVDWGEDQAFAWELLKNGYAKAYANAAVVYHSHDDDFDVVETRAHEEAKFFYTYFGYRPFETAVQSEIDLAYLNDRDERFANLNKIDRNALARRQDQNRALIQGRLRAMRDLGVIRC